MDVLTLVASLVMDSSEYDKAVQKAEQDAYKLGQSIGSAMNATGKAMTAPLTSVTKIPDVMNKAGQAISQVGTTISGIGSKIDSFITKPALGASAALAGVVLAKGWSRMAEIDQAKAKLRALGNDAEAVQSIMDSALASVKGTAFGMDEAATTAASAVAAGIEKGEDLTKYLTSVGDTAAIANTSMADMGAIFNKVTTAGKAQNDVLRQLSDRGIPIYQWLAEETGHASDEIFELAKDGEINLATFRAAIENHVGGAAKELGNATLTGAIKNVWAAISRVGANFLGAADDANSFAGQLLPIIIKVQEALGGVESKAKEYGAVLGQLFSAAVSWFETGSADMSKLGDTAQNIWGKIEPILNKAKEVVEFIKGLSPELVAGLGGLAVTIGPILKYGGMIVNLIGMIISSGPILIAGIAALIGVLAYLTATGKDTSGVFQFILDGINMLGEKIPEIAQKIIDAFPAIMEQLGQIASNALEVGTQIVSSIVQGISESMPQILEGALNFITTLGQALIENLPTLIESAYTLWQSMLEFVGGLLPELVPLAVNILLTIIQGIVDNIDKLVDGAIALMTGLAVGIVNAIPILVEKIPEILAAIVSAIIENAPKLLDAAIVIVQTLADGILTNFPIVGEVLDQIGAFIMEFATKAAEYFQPVVDAFQAAWEFIKTLFGVIKAFVTLWIQTHQEEINKFISTVKLVVEGFITTIKTIVSVAIDFFNIKFKAAFETITGIFKAATALLKGDVQGAADAIKGIINTHVEATKQKFESLKEHLSSWASSLKDKFASWGRDMIQNFINGITEKVSGVRDAITNVGDIIRSRIHFSEPDVGPLADFSSYAPDMMKLFAKGIKDNEYLVRNQVDKSFDFGSITNRGISQGVSSNANISINVYGSDGQSVKELAEAVGDVLMHQLNVQKMAMA